MNVRGAIRCCTCNRIFIVNFLVLVLNLNHYIYNYYHNYNFTVQRRTDDYSKEKGSTCNITNQAIICPYNWTSLEARVFASPMDSKERQLIDRMLQTFVETVEAANLTYFLMAGALLGSLRHHGPIPWDDDVDVIVKASEEDILLDVLSKLSPDFKLYAMKPLTRKYWKLYPSQGRLINYEYKTPFIDIFLYLENETHVWTATPQWQDQDIWLRRDVFPLHRRPYGELFLPAPCNSSAVVKSFADASMCNSRYWSHVLERGIHDIIKISCDHLAHIYPFVKSSIGTNRSSHLVKETLVLGDLTIREVMVENYCK